MGYATRALELLLPETREQGLPYLELVADADNLPSQRVIEANGGKLIERFRKSAEHGGKESLRFRVFVVSWNVTLEVCCQHYCCQRLVEKVC
jgi:predicted acetyltransferase